MGENKKIGHPVVVTEKQFIGDIMGMLERTGADDFEVVRPPHCKKAEGDTDDTETRRKL